MEQGKKIAVIQGGLGAEREVSLSTGKAFQSALDKLGYNYVVIDAKSDLPVLLAKEKPDVALLALHGKFAEDGTVQGVCEYLKIPYTGSGVLSSALCMDKYFSKQLYLQNNIPTADFDVYDLGQDNIGAIECRFDFPVVVKPSREGSSVGITIAADFGQFISGLEEASKYDRYVLVEEFIDGTELTVPILNGEALTPIEMVPKQGFYDYQAKYTAGKTEYHLPARLDEAILAEAKEFALLASEVCRTRSYCRVDFRVSTDGKIFCMEVNTLPGCTSTSLLPQSAAHQGIEFSELLDQIIKGASLDYEGVN